MPPVFSKPLSFGNIYCIYNDNLTNCYIGSTFDYEQRMEQHNKVCVNILLLLGGLLKPSVICLAES